ncbi:MAG TPA: A24 family peptidase [Tepidisphaeraceae bacterium]|jgi:prepilin peptidase CpaA
MAHVAVYLPLICLMTFAAVIDWRSRRLPNWLNLVILLIGVGLAVRGATHVGVGASLAGAGLGFLLLFPAFALGAIGGGDVKLLTAVGAWTGPLGILIVLLLTTVFGAVLSVAQAAQAGKLRALLRNSGVLAVNLVHARTLGADHIEQTGKRFRSIDRPLPYAVPMLAGTIVWLAAF